MNEYILCSELKILAPAHFRHSNGSCLRFRNKIQNTCTRSLVQACSHLLQWCYTMARAFHLTFHVVSSHHPQWLLFNSVFPFVILSFPTSTPLCMPLSTRGKLKIVPQLKLIPCWIFIFSLNCVYTATAMLNNSVFLPCFFLLEMQIFHSRPFNFVAMVKVCVYKLK